MKKLDEKIDYREVDIRYYLSYLFNYIVCFIFTIATVLQQQSINNYVS